MKQNGLIQSMEAEQLKKAVLDFRVGDTVSVHTRIIEGDKERIQVFTGTVIARKGAGLSETFSLYRISYGSGMERVFMLHSPKIAKMELVKSGKVRKSKLYYLRGAFGKKAKIQERIRGKVVESVATEQVSGTESAS
jgi:large subunit ribosomal protein L19